MQSAIHPALHDDRRREQRTPMKVDCVVSVNGRRRVAGLTRDISPSGAAILSSAVVVAGDTVTVMFDKAGRHSGRVVRVFEGGFAIEMKRASLALVPLSSCVAESLRF